MINKLPSIPLPLPPHWPYEFAEGEDILRNEEFRESESEDLIHEELTDVTCVEATSDARTTTHNSNFQDDESKE